jgi:asparagine synthase (glutamine-hydrolysing)
VPEEIWQRPKRPYRAPIQRSFFPRGKPLAWVADALSPTKLRDTDYFDGEAVANLIKKLERFGELGETDEMALTGILSTQLLHEQFMTTSSDAAHHHNPFLVRDDVKVVRRGHTILSKSVV